MWFVWSNPYQAAWAEAPWCPTTEQAVPAKCAASEPCAPGSSIHVWRLRSPVYPRTPRTAPPCLNRNILTRVNSRREVNYCQNHHPCCMLNVFYRARGGPSWAAFSTTGPGWAGSSVSGAACALWWKSSGPETSTGPGSGWNLRGDIQRSWACAVKSKHSVVVDEHVLTHIMLTTPF